MGVRGLASARPLLSGKLEIDLQQKGSSLSNLLFQIGYELLERHSVDRQLLPWAWH